MIKSEIDPPGSNRGDRWRRVLPIVVTVVLVVAAVIALVVLVAAGGFHGPTPVQCEGTLLDGPC